MNLFSSKYTVLLSLCVMIALAACDNELNMNGAANGLTFSTDTLTFDTVFTTIGSTTSKVMVYNKQNKAVKIDMVHLAGGASSPFRINVDGAKDALHQFQDIKLNARDSLFVFVEVHINPNDENMPVLVQDSIMFNVDGKRKRVLLEAYGQDVELVRSMIISQDTTLNAGKPYLVYDSITVEPDVTLTLAAGTRIYYRNNAAMIVYGNLRADGSWEQPIYMQGDRLDKINYDHPIPYKYVAGQWGGVFLLAKNGHHVLNHIDISSGTVGVYFYNEDKNATPYLEINNSRIHNFLLYNLVVVNGNVLVTNSEITNSGSYTVYLNGGEHQFYHCTIANLFSKSAGSPVSRDETPAVMLMDLNKQLPMESIFKNCVITGTAKTEFTIASKFKDLYKGDFQYNYLKRTEDSLAVYQHNRWYQEEDSLVFIRDEYDYKKATYFDFTPDSLSPLRGLADPTVAEQYPLDLKGRNRLADGEPDAGAYEWYPTAAQ